MDTDVLRWFQQVADGVTVTEVAEQYRTSQPAVSRALARLERDAGAPLLRKSGRVLRMTREGAAFKRHVDNLLNELDDGLAALSQLMDPETGSVSLAFHLSLGTWLVPELIRGFRADHPDVDFALTQLPDAREAMDLQRHRVDLALTTVASTDPRVQWRRLMTEPLHLAVHRRHRLATRPSLALADVAEEDFVALPRSSQLRGDTDALAVRAGFAPRVALECQDLPTACGLVAAGLGVAVVPAHLTLSGSAGWVSVPLTDEGAARQVGLSWSVDRRLLPAADQFRSHVVAAARAGIRAAQLV